MSIPAENPYPMSGYSSVNRIRNSVYNRDCISRPKADCHQAFIRTWLIVAVLLAPTAITESIRQALMPLISSVGCHKATPLMLVCLIAVWSCTFVFGKAPYSRKAQVTWAIGIFAVSAVISMVLRSNSENTPWLRIIEICVPLLLGLELAQLMPSHSDYNRSWEHFLKLVLVYLGLALFWWWTRQRFIFNIDPNLNFVRLQTTLTGAVTLGGLLTILLPFVIVFQAGRPLLYRIIVTVVFCAALLATGSRSAVYLAIPVLLLMAWGPYKRWRFAVIGMLLAAFGVIIIGLMSDFHIDRFARTETTRTASQIMGLASWGSDAQTFLVGKGLHQYYPYDEWFARSQVTQLGDDFRFFRVLDRDDCALVEPHSMYIWLAVETGLLGLALLFGWIIGPIFLKALRTIIRRKPETPPVVWGLSVSVLAVLGLSFAGSFMLNEPPIATICWFIFFGLDRWEGI